MQQNRVLDLWVSDMLTLVRRSPALTIRCPTCYERRTAEVHSLAFSKLRKFCDANSHESHSRDVSAYNIKLRLTRSDVLKSGNGLVTVN